MAIHVHKLAQTKQVQNLFTTSVYI